MNNLSKKISVVALAVTTIIWATGAMLYTPSVAHASVAGDLIKAPIGGAAVYYLAADGKRYTFPNEKIYHSWYSDFAGVKVITDAELASYLINGNVHYRPGTRLVKITTDPKVYAVTPGGVLKGIPDEATAAALYGSTWNQKIDDLPDAFFAPPNYTIGTALASGGGELPVGYLAKDAANQIYYISSGAKRPVANQAAMDANHFWSKFVFTPPASALTALSSGTSVTGAETLLIDSSEYTLRTGVVIPPTGASVTVSLAADTPAATTLPDGTIYNPLLKLNITASTDGDARLEGITITRGGFIASTYVTGVSLWDQSGVRHGSILTALTSEGKGTLSFAGDPVIVPAGQTRSVTVAANLSADTGSGTVNMAVVAAADLTFTGTPAKNGTFPLMGNTMSIVDGSTSVGAVTVEGLATTGASVYTTANLEVGQTNMEVGKFKITETSSREDIQVRQLVFYIEGDLNEATDLTNITVYASDGTTLGTVAHSVNRYATINFATPYTITQGQNRSLTVKADITGGANRWFRLQLQNEYDVLVRGVVTGANLLPSDGSGAWGAVVSTSGYYLIKQGALTISKSTASPSTNLTVGATSVELARFDLTANGENLEVQKLGIAIVRNDATDISLSGNLVIQDANTGTVYYTGTASSTTLYNVGTSAAYTTQTSLSFYIPLTTGVVKTLKVIGSISTNSTSGDTVQIGMGNAYVRRLNSLDYTSVATTGQLGNSLTIGASTLSVMKHNNPPDPNTVAPGSANAVIATFAIGNTANGAENVRISTIGLTFAGTGNINVPTQLTNVKLWDMSVSPELLLGSLGTAATSSSFNVNNWTINANVTKLLKVTTDINSAADATTLYVQLAANSIVGTGLTSNNVVQAPTAATNGQTNALTGAAVRLYADSSVTSKIVKLGTNGVEIAKYRFDVSYDDVTLNKITFRVSTTGAVTGTAAQASGTLIFGNFYLYDSDNTLLGSTYKSSIDAGSMSAPTTPYTYVSSTQTSSTADVVFTGLSKRFSANIGGTLSLRTDVANSGGGVTTTLGSAFIFSNANADLRLLTSAGSLLAATSVQTTSTSGVTSQSNKFLFIDNVPTVVAWQVTSKHIKGTTDEVARFEIRNYGQTPILLNGLGFNVISGGFTSAAAATTGGMDRVIDFKLYDDNDNFIATSTQWHMLCAGYDINTYSLCSASASLSTTTAFRGGQASASQNGGWEANNTILAPSGSQIYSSKFFSLRADTSNITANGGTSTRTLQVQVTGTKGFLSSDGGTEESTISVSSTRYWNAGAVSYKMSPLGSGVYTRDMDVLDDYPTSLIVSYQ